MLNRMKRSQSEIMRDEMVMRDEIAAVLAREPRTIPEIAHELGCPGHEVVTWVMAMWRYGLLKDTGQPDEDGYFRYELSD